MNRKMRDYTEIKSSLKSKIRSRPKVVSAGRYLDLYILNQEKTRLEHELCSVTGRMKNLESTLRDHQKSIDETEKELLLMKAGKSTQKTPDNSHKAMSIEY